MTPSSQDRARHSYVPLSDALAESAVRLESVTSAGRSSSPSSIEPPSSTETSIRNRKSRSWVRRISDGKILGNGYKSGIKWCLASVLLVFIVNLLFLIIGLRRSRTPDGTGTLQKGQCSAIKRTDLWIHLFINVLGTAIMGASNYSMQCLSAPTRDDIDRAHASQTWLDIGIHSFRNVGKVCCLRRALWLALGASSVPLQLLYNSVFFSTLSYQKYDVFAVMDTFSTSAFVLPPDNVDALSTSSQLAALQRSSPDIKRLDNLPCIEAFGTQFVSDFGALAVVLDTQSRIATNTYVVNRTISNGYIDDSTIIDSKVLNSSIFNTTITNSDISASSISQGKMAHSTISYSQIENNTLLNAVVNNSRLTTSQIFNSTLINCTTIESSLNQSNRLGDPVKTNDFLVDPQFGGLPPKVYPRSDDSLIGVWGNNSVFDNQSHTYPDALAYEWICGHDGQRGFDGAYARCDLKQQKMNASNWTLLGYEVLHCMALKAPAVCEFQFSLPLLSVVLACNVIKLICIGIVAWRSDWLPLITIGDAISSFLERPDLHTQNNCLVPNSVFSHYSRWQTDRQARQYDGKSHRHWLSAASSYRWTWTYALSLATIALALALVFKGVQAVKDYGGASIMDVGFGAIDSRAMIHPHGYYQLNLVRMVLLANTPQLLISLLYSSYNRLFTSMLLVKEFSNFALHRKPLRVSSPKGLQRSTYQLQLPYLYSVPPLIAAAILHWLVSQTIFLVRLKAYDWKSDNIPTDGITTCGYAPRAAIVTTSFAALVLVVGLASGFRRYESYMPQAGSCSAAISAACHPLSNEDKPSLKRLKWGAVRHGTSEEDPGHCTFSSELVTRPIHGKWYAGQVSDF